jgi:hypothetical protein
MIVVVVTSVATTGCSSSGWKMPSPSKMFPWGKKPNEAALTKSGASALTYPESPAAKQTPNAVASAAVKGPTSTLGTPSSVPPNALTAKPNSSSPYAPPATTGTSAYTPPGAGAAATANGYATGPYNTFGQSNPAAGLAANGVPNKPGVPAPNSSVAAGQSHGMTGVPGTATGMAANNPYALASSPNPGLPNSQFYAGTPAPAASRPATTAPAMPNMPTTGVAIPGSLANSPKPVPTAGAVASAPLNAGYPSPQMAPGAYQAPPVPTNPQAMPVAGGLYNPVGSAAPYGSVAQTNQGMPTMQGNFAGPGMAALTSNGLSQIPAQTASYSNPASNASYRPGSTSRTTGYSFPGQTSATTASSATNVATGTANPGYSLPPASSLNR